MIQRNIHFQSLLRVQKIAHFKRIPLTYTVYSCLPSEMSPLYLHADDNTLRQFSCESQNRSGHGSGHSPRNEQPEKNSRKLFPRHLAHQDYQHMHSQQCKIISHLSSLYSTLWQKASVFSPTSVILPSESSSWKDCCRWQWPTFWQPDRRSTIRVKQNMDYIVDHSLTITIY